MKAYEAPELTTIGSVADFTRGSDGEGDVDSIWTFFGWDGYTS